jgi:DNA mismatch repair protein MutS
MTAVQSLHADLILRENLRAALDGILDLERLLGRISLDSARPRDLLALAVSLRKLPNLRHALEPLTSDLWHQCRNASTRSKTFSRGSRRRLWRSLR